MANIKSYVEGTQELRRSNAATPVPARRVRREKARAQQTRAAVQRSMRGE